MNLLAPVSTPWRSVSRSLRWLAAVVLLLATLAAVAVAVFSRVNSAVLAATVLGLGVVFLWAFFMPGMLLLAIDAHRLRLPGVQREIHASLALYAALCIVPAAALAGASGADAPTVGVLLALCAVAGFTFAVLPRYIAVVFGFVPALHAAFKHILHLPGPGEQGFVSWASVAILILLLVCTLRWQQLRDAHELPEGLSGPLMLQLRRSGAWGHWNSEQIDSPQVIRRRPDWLQARADLRGTGPGRPLATFRVALGHWYTPRTFVGHLHAMAPVLLPLLLGFGAMVLIGVANGRRPATLEALKVGGVAMIGWVGVFGSIMLTLATVQLVHARWRKPNTELPLLSLLPGLGDTARTKRELLRAVLQRPLGAQAILLVVMLAAGLALHLPALGLLSVAVAQLGGAAVMAACVPAILGGRPLPTWGLALLLIVLFILIGLGSFLPLAAGGAHPWEQARHAIEIVLGLWLVAGVVLLWIGRRGWRALARRPHAFLVNAG